MLVGARCVSATVPQPPSYKRCVGRVDQVTMLVQAGADVKVLVRVRKCLDVSELKSVTLWTDLVTCMCDWDWLDRIATVYRRFIWRAR